jgi:hypothetical protein
MVKKVSYFFFSVLSTFSPEFIYKYTYCFSCSTSTLYNRPAGFAVLPHHQLPNYSVRHGSGNNAKKVFLFNPHPSTYYILVLFFKLSLIAAGIFGSVKV